MSSTDEKVVRPIRVGVYQSIAAAEGAVAALQHVGFSDSEITVFCPNREAQRQFEENQPPGEKGAPVDHIATGSAVGGTIGGLTVAATIATAGGAPVIVAGGIAGLLTGGVVGGLAGAMANRGLEKESADYFDQAVAENRILVSVEPEEKSAQRMELASHTMEKAGAQAIPLREG